jgi:hypothetical protein
MEAKSKSLVASLLNGGLRNIAKFVRALQRGNRNAWIGAAVVAALALYRLSRKPAQEKPMLVFEHLQVLENFPARRS